MRRLGVRPRSSAGRGDRHRVDLEELLTAPAAVDGDADREGRLTGPRRPLLVLPPATREAGRPRRGVAGAVSAGSVAVPLLDGPLHGGNAASSVTTALPAAPPPAASVAPALPPAPASLRLQVDHGGRGSPS